MASYSDAPVLNSKFRDTSCKASDSLIERLNAAVDDYALTVGKARISAIGSDASFVDESGRLDFSLRSLDFVNARVVEISSEINAMEVDDFFWASLDHLPFVPDPIDPVSARLLYIGEVCRRQLDGNWEWVGFDVWDENWMAEEVGEGGMLCAWNLLSRDGPQVIPYWWSVLNKLKSGWILPDTPAADADDFNSWFNAFVGDDANDARFA